MDGFTRNQLIQNAAEEFETKSPQALLDWAVQRFPSITLACSFGAEDVALVDMLYKLHPNVDIFYLDTDFHFQETYETRDRIMEKYPNIQLVQVSPKLTPEEQAQQYGDQLWANDPNACCNIRKVEPLTNILGHDEAWITGIRRDQAPTRANVKKVEYDLRCGVVEFNPLASWTSEDVWQSIQQHDVIYTPLHDLDYPGIGCHYCTRPVKVGD